MNMQVIKDKGPLMNGIDMPPKPVQSKLNINPFEDILEEHAKEEDFDDF